MKQKTKMILRWIPSVLIALQISAGAAMKLSANSFMVKNFQNLGLLNFMGALGCMELLFVVLFMWKRTMKVGLFLLTAYFGGAIAVEMANGNPGIPGLVLMVIWFAAWLREPGIFKMNAKVPAFAT